MVYFKQYCNLHDKFPPTFQGSEIFCSLLVAYYLLPVTRYFFLVACYVLLVARYLFLVACYFLLVVRYFLVVARYFLICCYLDVARCSLLFCSLLVTFCLLLFTFCSLLVTKTFSISILQNVYFVNNLKTRTVLNWSLSAIFMGTRNKIT